MTPIINPAALDNVSPHSLKKAKNCTVRECDQEENNRFVAYIDQGEESFDVMIQLDDSGNIVSKSCECAESKKTYCVHQLALFLSLEKKKAAPKKVVKKKKSPVDEILNELPIDQLRDWASETLKKNKELQINFISKFSKSATLPNETEINAQLLAAIKAVIGRTKSINATQAKKIMSLWANQNEQVISYFKSHPHEETSYVLIAAILKYSANHCLHYHIKNPYIEFYGNSVVSICLEHFATVDFNKNWEKSLENILMYWCFKSNTLIEYVDEIIGFSNKLDELKKESLSNKLIAFQKLNEKKLSNVGPLEHLSLDIAMSLDSFKNKINDFKAGKNHNYNIKLIKKLTTIKEYKLAEKYSLENIDINNPAHSDRFYWTLLAEIYGALELQKKRLEVLQKIVLINFDTEYYSEVMRLLKTATEKNNFRSEVYFNAMKDMQKGYAAALTFGCWLARYENNTENLFNILQMQNSLFHIEPYLQEMYNINKMQLLKSIFLSQLTYFFEYDSKPDFSRIIQFISDHYDSSEIKMVLTDQLRKRAFQLNTITQYFAYRTL